MYYHLGELDESVNLALGAGAMLDVADPSEYTQTILARCIDQYVAARAKAEEAGEEATIDPRYVRQYMRMNFSPPVFSRFVSAPLLDSK